MSSRSNRKGHAVKKNQPAQISITKTTLGPVADPETLEYYERLVPGSAKLSFDLWKDQVHHRHAMELAESNQKGEVIKNQKDLHKAYFSGQRFGQICGLVISLSTTMGGLVLAFFAETNAKAISGSGITLFALWILYQAFKKNRPETPPGSSDD